MPLPHPNNPDDLKAQELLQKTPGLRPMTPEDRDKIWPRSVPVEKVLSSNVSVAPGLSTDEPTGKSPQGTTEQSVQMVSTSELINSISALGYQLVELATQLRLHLGSRIFEPFDYLNPEDYNPGVATLGDSVRGSQPDPVIMEHLQKRTLCCGDFWVEGPFICGECPKLGD